MQDQRWPDAGRTAMSVRHRLVPEAMNVRAVVAGNTQGGRARDDSWIPRWLISDDCGHPPAPRVDGKDSRAGCGRGAGEGYDVAIARQVTPGDPGELPRERLNCPG